MPICFPCFTAFKIELSLWVVLLKLISYRAGRIYREKGQIIYRTPDASDDHFMVSEETQPAYPPVRKYFVCGFSGGHYQQPSRMIQCKSVFFILCRLL